VESYDVVIVGARCAGSSLATLLARRGLRVCVVDQAKFPSDTPSTHVIQPAGVAVLDRLKVLDAVFAAGAVTLERLTMVLDDVRFDAAIGSAGWPGVSIRRSALDVLLVEAAIEAGAQVRTNAKVSGLLKENSRVVGVQTAAGAVRAALVVGADGRRSTVAAAVGATEYRVSPAGRLFSWAYFDSYVAGADQLRLARIGELAFVGGPTDSGGYLAAFCPSVTARKSFLADREGSYAAGLRGWPELTDMVAGARRVGPVRVVADWHGFFRTAAGPGWVLVGDAGHFKDPAPGQGMADAFRHAEQLADVIGTGLGGPDLDAELAAWGRRRDRETTEMHWFAADLGAAGKVQPLTRQLMRDIAGDPAGPEQFVKVLNRDIRPSQLFGSRQLGAALIRAAIDRPAKIPAITREAAATVRTTLRRARS
jgi:2-polyprenyl-6-methoxyphenol hydroxylase-like FAD-dependent oxidoreductase